MHIVRKPRLVYLLRTFYLITVRIDRMTLLEKHLAIARLTSRHKQYQIVLGRKGGNIRHAVSHLPADGIKALERSPWLYVLLNIVYNTMKSVERLGSLRVKIDIAREVETFHIIHLFHNYGTTLCLPYKTKHFGMTTLSEYNNLRIGIGIVLSLYTALQGKHYRTCSIYYLNVVVACHCICFRRFAMSTQQHFNSMQLAHLIVINGC